MRRGASLLAAVVLCCAPLFPVVAQEVIPLPAEDRSVQARPEPVYTVGAMDGAPWETFSQLNQVEFDGRGNLHVLDAGSFRIVVVSPEGELVREIGHEGGGPGEFRRPAALAVHADGRIAVFDMGHRAFLYFDSEGEFVGQRSLELSEMPGRQIEFLPDGSVVSASGQGVVMMTRGPGGEGPSSPTTVPIRRYPWGESGSVSVLHEAWLPPRGESTVSSSAGRLRMVGLPQPRAFEPRFAFGVLPDGRIAYSDTVTYGVKLLDPDQGLETVLSRPLEPREVTRRDREREQERRLAQLEEGEGPQLRVRAQGSGGGSVEVPQEAIRQMMEQRIASLEFSEEFPVIADMAVDRQGRIWVERTAEDYQEEGPIDLLSPTGEYLGTLPPGGPRIPDAFGPDGLAAYIVTGELDVPMVEVKRIAGLP